MHKRAALVRCVLETSFLLCGIILLSVLLSRSIPTIIARYQYEGRQERASNLPIVVPTESEQLRVTATVWLPSVHVTKFILEPDDCIETMVVNNSLLSDDVKFCNANPGKRVNLGPYLHAGMNTIAWTIRDTGGTGGIAMPVSWIDPIILTLTLSIVLLVMLVGMRLLYWLRPGKKGEQMLWLLILLCLVLRLSLSWHAGYGYDIGLNKGWARSAVEVGIGHSYRQQFDNTAIPNYPPLSLIIFGATGYAYRFLISPSFDTATLSYHVAIKMPAMIADAVICLVLFMLCRKSLGEKKSLIAVALYALHPVAIMDAAIWGQTDAIFTCAMLLSILCAVRRQWIGCGVFCAAALLLKAQAIVLLPLLCMLCLTERTVWWKIMIGGLLCTVVVCFPFLWSGTLIDVVRVYQGSVGYFSSLTMNAFNFWTALYGPDNGISDTSLFLGVSYRLVGIELFILATVILSATYWRSLMHRKPTLQGVLIPFLYTALVASAFFLFNTEMHERYLFPFIALGLPFIFTGKRGVALYALGSLFIFANIVKVLSISGFDQMLFKEFSGLPVCIAAGQIFVFVGLFFHLYAWQRPSSLPSSVRRKA